MAKTFTRLFIALAFVGAGINHFRRPEMYKSIMPDYLPWHGPLVAISGYAEMMLGTLVLLPRWKRPARWGLTALLIAVFPANVHMALHSDRYPRSPRWLLWLRLPLQGLLIWLVWRSIADE